MYKDEVGRQGPGRPKGRSAILEGLGDTRVRGKAQRRAASVLKERHYEEYASLVEAELKSLAAEEKRKKVQR